MKFMNIIKQSFFGLLFLVSSAVVVADTLDEKMPDISGYSTDAQALILSMVTLQINSCKESGLEVAEIDVTEIQGGLNVKVSCEVKQEIEFCSAEGHEPPPSLDFNLDGLQHCPIIPE